MRTVGISLSTISKFNRQASVGGGGADAMDDGSAGLFQASRVGNKRSAYEQGAGAEHRSEVPDLLLEVPACVGTPRVGRIALPLNVCSQFRRGYMAVRRSPHGTRCSAGLALFAPASSSSSSSELSCESE